MKTTTFGIACFIIRDGHIFLSRVVSSGEGSPWDVPMARSLVGELPVDTAGRELLSEHALTVTAVTVFGEYVNPDVLGKLQMALVRTQGESSPTEGSERQATWYAIDALPTPLGRTVRHGLVAMGLLDAA